MNMYRKMMGSNMQVRENQKLIFRKESCESACNHPISRFFVFKFWCECLRWCFYHVIFRRKESYTLNTRRLLINGYHYYWSYYFFFNCPKKACLFREDPFLGRFKKHLSPSNQTGMPWVGQAIWLSKWPSRMVTFWSSSFVTINFNSY